VILSVCLVIPGVCLRFIQFPFDVLTVVYIFCLFGINKFLTLASVHHNSMLIKIQPDATVCRYLFTAKSLYIFRLSQHPSSGVLKTVTATSDTGHTVK